MPSYNDILTSSDAEIPLDRELIVNGRYST